jgi:cytosine/adenosine deaminase-related metal-dependent hydrolase
VIKNGAVYVEGNTICEIGNYEKLRKERHPDYLLGSSHHLVMPGLVNAHYHGGWGSLQLGVVDSPLETWLSSYRLLQSFSQLDSYSSTLFGCLKQLESGVTSTLDHHYGFDPINLNLYGEDCEAVVRAYEDSGMRVAFAPVIANQNNLLYLEEERFVSELPKETRELFEPYRRLKEDDSTRRKFYFKNFTELLKKHRTPEGKINFLFGASGVQWCSEDLLQELKKEAKKYAVGIHLHLLETKYQRIYGFKTYGKSTIRHLVEMGFLGPEVSCAHCVWLTKEDIDLFAKAQATAVHNPSSNLRLSSGVSPVSYMIDRGVNVALGLDGLTMNDDDDLFQEMRLCSLLQHMPGIDSKRLMSNQVLDMATIGGAKALGLENKIGVVQEGLKADLILVNLKRAFTPVMNSTVPITDVVLYILRGRDVDSVIINGEIVMQNKKFAKVNKEELIRNIRNQAKEMDTETKRRLDEFNRRLTNFYKRWDKENTRHVYTLNDGTFPS